MTDQTAPAQEPSEAELAFNRFVAEVVASGPEEAKHAGDAPKWSDIPEHARPVIARYLMAQAAAPAQLTLTEGDDQGYGRIGYQAYVQSTGGLNYQGLPCPEWPALPEKIRKAWGAAATVIRAEHEHRNAADFDLAVSHEELAELVAGLDALQRAEKHTAEVTHPLRGRLRGLLFPPADEPAPETVDDPPLLEVAEVEPHGLEASKTAGKDVEPPKLPGSYDDYHDAVGAPQNKATATPGDEVIGDGDLKPANAATQSPAPERTDPATKTEPSPASAPASAAPVLPSVSEGPQAPPLPGLEPVIPGPPGLPTDTGPSLPTSETVVHEDTDAGPDAAAVAPKAEG